MIDTLQAIWANDLYRKLILSGLVLLVMHLIRRVLNWVLQHKVSFENPYIYLLRKVSSYLISILTVFFIFGIWIERLGDLSVALGIMTAGLAFALQEVIGSFAGWLTIVGGKPFSVGDRIETSHIRGDVVDVGILRTKIMEIGNWLHGDHNTGRIVTVSNALIFKEPLFNYSILFHYIYDEIVIPVIYDCDWKRAIEIMHRAVSENQHYQTLLPKARKSWEQARQQYLVKISPLEPRVFVNLTDNWIELSLVYPVDNDLRRSFRSEISTRILEDFAAESITVASQTIAIVDFPEVRTAVHTEPEDLTD